ncbi:ComEC/Rec2 family competence protein [Pseudonocardia sp. SCN 73-27]|uniref:ComEC/Rec2 family competence protein n=1 Tax=Pseudonocardia sp. SCN 73-27 TaxID=1660132 RepID=UPI0026A0FB8F
MLVALLVLVGFVVLVTPEPSVVRAAAMSAIGILALGFGRLTVGIAVLAAAVTALLIADPWLCRSLGFALSTAATAALLVLARPLADGLGRWMPRPLALALAVPTSAQLACGPLIVLIDPHVPLLGVAANLLADPAAELRELGVAGLPGGAGLLPRLGQLGAHPFQLEAELVDARQCGVELGTQLPRLAAAGGVGDEGRGVGGVAEDGERGGAQRVVGVGGRRVVLVAPGQHGGPERRGRAQLAQERLPTEAGPLGRGEPGEATQPVRDVGIGQARDGGRGELGEATADGFGEAVPVERARPLHLVGRGVHVVGSGVHVAGRGVRGGRGLAPGRLPLLRGHPTRLSVCVRLPRPPRMHAGARSCRCPRLPSAPCPLPPDPHVPAHSRSCRSTSWARLCATSRSWCSTWRPLAARPTTTRSPRSAR